MATAPLPSWAAQPDKILYNLLGTGGTNNPWASLSLTYAFPATVAGVTRPFTETFTPIPAADRPAFALALGLWDDLIAASIKPFEGSVSGPTSQSFEFAYFERAEPGGYAVRGAEGSETGSLWINRSYVTPALLAVGGYAFTTILHELGHGLGLDHPGPYNNTIADALANALFFEDSAVYTLMSYLGPSSGAGSGLVEFADWIGADFKLHSPQTPMIWDLRALQAIYGSARDTRLGDTVYGFNSTITGDRAQVFDFRLNAFPILTLFDSGGIDTLDLSGFATGSLVDLRPGASSNVAAMTKNLWIGDGVDIENARTGAASDSLVGNTLANRLEAGAGDDALDGREGDDILIGGPGNDRIEGGAGQDTAVYSGSYAQYRATINLSTQRIALKHASEGTDLITGIEWFEFADQRLSLEALVAAATTEPTLLRTTPADNSTRVPTSGVFVFEFSEPVKAGAGDIEIRFNTGSAERIPMTDPARVRFDGPLVIVDPKFDLFVGSSYYVAVPFGAVVSANGNAFGGRIGPTDYNFTVSAGNRNPVVAAASLATDEDSVFAGRLPTATDADGDALIYLLVTAPLNGRATVARDGALRYEPQANFSGPDSLTFDVIDAMGGRTRQTLALQVAEQRDIFAGTEGNDDMPGYAGGDTYRAGAGDDRIRPGAGDDVIDGGLGLDVVRLDGLRTAFVVERDGDGWAVRSGSQGRDAVVGVERLLFDDRALALDIDGGHGGQAARLVNALFGHTRLADPALVGTVLSYLDQGMSYPELVAAAVAHPFFAVLAGSTSNSDFVRWVYRNVVGQPPGADEAASFVSLLDGGTFTQQSLALLAADHPLNFAAADLVGLAQTGLDYFVV